MAGKGKRRREKNYRAAHEGLNSRLPPPPESSSLDALPSKLRKLIALSSSSPNQASPTPTSQGSANVHVGVAKMARRGNGDKSNAGNEQVKTNKDDWPKSQDGGDNDEVNAVNSKKKKRKKSKVDDLRFTAELEKLGVRSSRRERKKEYLKAKKKKQKGNVQEDAFDAPRRDIVKFGETVLAPPKLASVPRAPKKPLEASKERLRLQAVEAYRSRRKWESRPGLHLPSLVAEESSSLQS